MKLKLFFIPIAALGLLFTGCNDDDDPISIDPAIENAFKNQYPQAKRVEWERKAGYYVAEFHQGNAETQAWYSAQAVWYMTETDMTFAELPAEIRTAFAASIYKDWRVDDVDKLQRKDLETVYVIEVEKGREEYDLYYSADGVLIKAVPDDGHDSSGYLPGAKPAQIDDYIKTHYPTARIVEVETERDRIEVDIVDGKVARELTFTLAGEWTQTKTEIRTLEVPPQILAVLAGSQYGSWRVDDVDFIETPTVDYYLFELESGDREVHLKIDTNGTIL